MNKIDRLLAIVLELQGRNWRRAQDLATTFETSKRTIYRDLRALGQAGVPIVSLPGRGYSLVEGYFLPPLNFTVEEATVLLLGGDLMAQTFDSQFRTAAESASRKIAGVLPERVRAAVAALRESVEFVVECGGAGRSERLTTLRLLRHAILDRRSVRFRYVTRHRTEGEAPSGKPELRTVDPYSLINFQNIWYLGAYCHVRRDVRTFRLDRIDDLDLLDATFARPPGFRMWGRDHTTSGSVIVRALFASEAARWVRESRSFFAVAEEETPDGLVVTFAVREERELLQWLLSWGQRVRVLEPESLRRLLAAEADTMLRQHTSTPTSPNSSAP